MSPTPGSPKQKLQLHLGAVSTHSYHVPPLPSIPRPGSRPDAAWFPRDGPGSRARARGHPPTSGTRRKMGPGRGSQVQAGGSVRGTLRAQSAGAAATRKGSASAGLISPAQPARTESGSCRPGLEACEGGWEGSESHWPRGAGRCALPLAGEIGGGASTSSGTR